MLSKGCAAGTRVSPGLLSKARQGSCRCAPEVILDHLQVDDELGDENLPFILYTYIYIYIMIYVILCV